MSVLWSAYDLRPRAPRSCRGGLARAVKRGLRAKLRDVLEPANLYRVLLKMRKSNGPAPGIDCVRYDDLSRSEWFELFRDVRERVLAGTFCPQPPRLVEIAKAGGGTRTLRLAVILDRVFEKALADALTPRAEAVFQDCSYGFRPKRDRFWMLAALKVACETHGLWVLTADDIRKAFDHVPVAAAVTALRRLGVDPALIALAEIFLKGHEQREVGIAQGGALSPPTLNTLLHFALDTLLTVSRDGRHPVRYLRYADNLVLITSTAAEGRELLERMRTLLADVGLTLKGDPGEPRHLATGQHLDLLGLRLTRTGHTLTFQIPNTKWADLQTKLVAAHEEADPTAARTLVIGWVQAHAPALGFCRDEEIANRLINLLRRTGHRNALTKFEIVRTMRAASSRWEQTVADARIRLTPSPTANTSTDTALHASDVRPGDEVDGTDEDTHGTVTTPGVTDARDGTTETGTASSSRPPSADSSRPSGRSPALPDRPAILLSAPTRRVRSESAVHPRVSRPSLRARSGRTPTNARPPPRMTP